MSIVENCSQNHSLLQKEAIGAMTLELLKKGQACLFEAVGTSMLPQLRSGDLVLIEGNRTKNLKVGDIVLLNRLNKSGKYLIHRVLNIKNHDDEIQIYTKGDSSTRDVQHFDLENVFGKATVFYRGAYSYNLEHFIWQLFNPWIARCSSAWSLLANAYSCLDRKVGTKPHNQQNHIPQKLIRALIIVSVLFASRVARLDSKRRL